MLRVVVLGICLVAMNPLVAGLQAAEGIQLPPEIPTFKGQTAADFEAHIRASYALVERYSQRSGNPVKFQLSDFKTRPISAIGSEPYVDLATLPNDWVLSLHRSFHSDWIEGERTLTYLYRWEHRDTDWTAFPEGRRMLSATTKEILDEVAQHFPEYGHVKWATQYAVVVEFTDRKREYEAAFLWLPGEAPDTWYAATSDHIVQGLDIVNAEVVPPTGIPLNDPENAEPQPIEPETGDFQHSGASHVDVVDHLDSGSATCIADSANELLPQSSVPGTNGHITGKHWSEIDMTFDCSCDTSCTSKCQAGWSWALCDEEGTHWDACQKMGWASDFSSTGRADALLEGAACAAGYACAQKACLFCQCNFSVGVDVVGVSVTFEPTDADWTGNLQGAWTCGRCSEDGSSGGSDTGEEATFTCSSEHACTSPILISMYDANFALTSAIDGVAFDIDADGQLDKISWTAPGSDEVFLAMDRNHNGRIDDGRELFGDSTQQAPSSDPNGFLALAWYDRPQRLGNGDLQISAQDGVFQHLLVWQDANHDGISQSSELISLEDTNIVAIRLDYFVSGRQDRHGNQFRWTSGVEFDTGRRLAATDAILRTADED